MDNLIKRYKDKTTSEGHKLDVKEKSEVITVGFRHSGEYQDEYDTYIKVARIEKVGEAYSVGWSVGSVGSDPNGARITRKH
jgi:hypothetical protein